MFRKAAPGRLVRVAGTDQRLGPWEHRAFVPDPLSDEMPALEPTTFLAVAEARAALAALDSTAQQLPDPTLLRIPTLRLEAQSTSALEGTYAPVAAVLTADEDAPPSPELREILNYVRAANHGFSWLTDKRPLTVGFVSDLQGLLMRGTALEHISGKPREDQVVIGRRMEAPPTAFAIHAARFVPPPPGPELSTGLHGLIDWLQQDHSDSIDPVVAAAMSHYQFETLHPFRDGNGRIGRLLIVLHLQISGVVSEPTLTVSPWFEARRAEYYDHLLAVSTRNDWDSYVRFFANGLCSAARSTREEMVELTKVHEEMKRTVKASALRAGTAQAVVDLAVANPTFTVAKVERELGVSYGRANKLVGQLTDLGLLKAVDPNAYQRRFYAPRVIDVLTRTRRA